MEEVNITIIGAGVVGLAIAAELSTQFDNIVVLEKHKTFGQETSSRNSEVIHSGIYYSEGFLKAKLCVEGARLLYEICDEYSIPYKKLGKLIAAVDPAEVSTLEGLLEKGLNNDVKDLTILDKSEVDKIQPHINAVAALYSPHTGIVDSHSLMKHFFNKAEDSGVIFSFNCEAHCIDKEKAGFVVGIKQEGYQFRSKVVINSAGLSSDYIAKLAGIDIDRADYRLKYCKGTYFSYAKPTHVKMLIYPVPHNDLTGLGVHATLDLGGRLRFGPDAEYTDTIDYKVDSQKKDSFFNSAIKIIPGLEKEAFIPDMVGMRPKLQGIGQNARDFIIADETEKGLRGLINLIGIESPGLTASVGIAKKVADMVTLLI